MKHCVLTTFSQSTGICCLLADGRHIRHGQGLTSWATARPMASLWLSQGWRQHLGLAQVTRRSRRQLGCQRRQMVVWRTWHGSRQRCSSTARRQQVGSYLLLGCGGCTDFTVTGVADVRQQAAALPQAWRALHGSSGSPCKDAGSIRELQCALERWIQAWARTVAQRPAEAEPEGMWQHQSPHFLWGQCGPHLRRLHRHWWPSLALKAPSGLLAGAVQTPKAVLSLMAQLLVIPKVLRSSCRAQGA